MFTTSRKHPWSFVTQIFDSGQPSHGGDRKVFEVMNSTLPKGTLGSVVSFLTKTHNKPGLTPRQNKHVLRAPGGKGHHKSPVKRQFIFYQPNIRSYLDTPNIKIYKNIQKNVYS